MDTSTRVKRIGVEQAIEAGSPVDIDRSCAVGHITNGGEEGNGKAELIAGAISRAFDNNRSTCSEGLAHGRIRIDITRHGGVITQVCRVAHNLPHLVGREGRIGRPDERGHCGRVGR